MSKKTESLTDFQKSIIDVLRDAPNRMLNTWTIAAYVRPKKWEENPQSRSGIVTQVRMATRKCDCLGWIAPKNQYEQGHVVLRKT